MKLLKVFLRFGYLQLKSRIVILFDTAQLAIDYVVYVRAI